MIPHEYIEELTRRTDIVELVGGYVQLSGRAGSTAVCVPSTARRPPRSTSIRTPRASIALAAVQAAMQ